MDHDYDSYVAKERPDGVGLVAWSLIGIAGLAAALLIAWHALRIAGGVEPPGIPLTLLLQIAVVAVVLAAPASGLRNGKKWAWFVTLLYFMMAVVGAIWLAAMAIAGGATAGSFPGLTTPVLAVLAAILTAIVVGCTFAYLYLMRPNVRDWFELAEARPWSTVAAHAVICGLVVAGLTYSGFAVVRNRTVDRLQALGHQAASDEDDVRFLIERLEQGTRDERLSAAWALGQSRREDVVPDLERAAREDADAPVRLNAIAALTYMGAIDADLFVDSLQDPDEEVRAAALRGLADPRFADLAVHVRAVLTTDSARLRAAAADTLGIIGNPDATPALIEAAADDDKDVASSVAFALGKLGDPSAIPALAAMLDDDRWEVRANAAQALGMIGGRSAVAELREHALDPNDHVRRAVERALARSE